MQLCLRKELKETEPTHNADASRAALMAVADANSKLQMQACSGLSGIMLLTLFSFKVATLTEQRTTLSSGLAMVQQELDLKHENNIDLQASTCNKSDAFGNHCRYLICVLNIRTK